MEGTKTELQLIKLSEIQSQEVSWLWFPFISYGKLTIVQGDPGDGKTTFVLNIAAKLTKGEGLDGEMKLTEPLNALKYLSFSALGQTRFTRVTEKNFGVGYTKESIRARIEKRVMAQEKFPVKRKFPFPERPDAKRTLIDTDKEKFQ